MVKVLVEVDSVRQVVKLSTVVFIVRLRLRSTPITLIVLTMLTLIFLLDFLILLILVVKDCVFHFECGHKACIMPEESAFRADH